jgi:flagellar biosynthesis protein FlhG
MDQAATLRRLVADSSSLLVDGNAAHMIVLLGGMPKLGLTSLAIELGTALAADALRVVLIDADLHPAADPRDALAPRCGLMEAAGLGEVLGGTGSIHELLQIGPAGVQVIPGSRLREAHQILSDRSVRRCCRQLQSLARHVDWILVDAGSESNLLTARLASIANRLWLLTSSDAAAVMDTYALMKTLISNESLARPFELVVSGADAAQAADVHRRIDQSCRRFLGQAVDLVGRFPLNSGHTTNECVSLLVRQLLETTGDSVRRRAA